jgi:hypothetical protein
MELITFPPSLAVLTNAVTSRPLIWSEYEYELCHGGWVPPLIVSPVNRNLKRAYIILDGNHRTCLCAKHGYEVPAYVMTHRTTPNEILELESNQQIRYFPHREFLVGGQSFRQIITGAIKAAFELNETVAQVLRRIEMSEQV